MKEELFEFSEIKSFYKYFQPLTPYGKNNKSRKELYFSAKELNDEYDLLEKTISFIRDNQFSVDKIEYYLKRIPLLNSPDVKEYDSVDIFLIKKYLFNYYFLIENLSSEIKKSFGVFFSSDDLFNLLNIEGKVSEIFYLSEKYSKGLAEVRKNIKHLNDEVKKLKKERLQIILKEFGLDFRFKDFLVIEEERAVKLNKEYLFLEPFDNRNYIVKPVFQEEILNLHLKKERLILKEQKCEEEVIAKIYEAIRKEKKNIKKYIAIVEKLDLLIAKSRVCIKFDMKRPQLQEYGSLIKIKEARFIPLLEKCRRLQISYRPLNVAFNNRVIVIHGSNMGGKTVLLKTIIFSQILIQLGFYVPAQSFETVIFDNFYYIGEVNFDTIEGLSSFGLEMHTFMNAYQDIKGKTLYLIDEFARATNSREAAALISAILKEFNENPAVYAFVSTHFVELPEFENLSFYRMKGLNYNEYAKYYNKDLDYDLIERIRLINRFMEYVVIPDKKQEKIYDTLKIAQILGLNRQIIHYAKQYLGEEDEK